MKRGRRFAGVALVGIAACSRAPVAPAPPARASSVAASATRVASAPPTVSALTRTLHDDCAPEFAPNSGSVDRLSALQKHCLAGMSPLLEPTRFDVAQDGEHRIELPVTEPARCLRIIAAGGDRVQELELELLDPRAKVYATSTQKASYALLAGRGPLCVGEPGTYSLVARVRRGSGDVALAAYRAD